MQLAPDRIHWFSFVIKVINSQVLQNAVKNSDQQTRGWLKDTVALNTLPFADDQIIPQESGNELQRRSFHVNNICKSYNLKILIMRTKIMVFKRKYPTRTKIAIKDKTLEQVNDFRYLGCDATFQQETDTDVEIQEIQNTERPDERYPKLVIYISETNCYTRIRLSIGKENSIFSSARLTRMRHLVTFGKFSNNVDTHRKGSIRVAASRIAICYGCLTSF
jgi:hypothetical protein